MDKEELYELFKYYIDNIMTSNDINLFRELQDDNYLKYFYFNSVGQLGAVVLVGELFYEF